MKSKRAVQATQVRIKPELHRALRIAAVKAGISMNAAINEAVEMWLRRNRETGERTK
jgi:predicted HicB family RNase H-like nuclease